jgi:hypothetical protein
MNLATDEEKILLSVFSPSIYKDDQKVAQSIFPVTLG